MITLPGIRGIPAVYESASQSAVAARCALLLAPDGPIPATKARKDPVEIAQLRRQLQVWMETVTQGLQIFKPKLHLAVDRAPECGCCEESETPMSLWLINQSGDAWLSRWRVDRRWGELQRQAPGMAAAALDAIAAASSAGIPIYHPHTALALCSWIHWMGEDTEKFVIGNHDMTPEQAEKEGFITRRWLEQQLPPIAKANRRGIGRLRLAQSWGPRRDIARAILVVYDAIAENAPQRRAIALHREQDDYCCVGYGATVRWNEDDPMARIYDDYANGMFESHHVEEHWGWYPIANPARQLKPVLEQVRRRFNVARAVEKLLPLVAEEVH